MRIRMKIVAIVLPLLVVALIVAGVSASSLASNSVSKVAVEFLAFKTDQLEQYIDGQWRILLDNQLNSRTDMVQAAQAGIEVFARSIVRSETEVIFALDDSLDLVLTTADLEIGPEELERLSRAGAVEDRALQSFVIDGVSRVGTAFRFDPFGWTVFVTEQRDAFYSDVDRITYQTIYIIVIGSAIAVALLVVFVTLLTAPLRRVVGTMRQIITTNDLSGRAPVDYRDEIGEMSKTFNVMIEELETAYDRIKRYAYEAVLSQKREQKIRVIFQKYVPQDLIDRFFANPESMLVGENRDLAVLFSDIRSFTTISETMSPDILVSALNRYFSVMVDLIMNRDGIIDKYIGDAIMAFFGAPVQHDNDPLQSVMAGIEMIEALDAFNEGQRAAGQPEFHIGVGINFGEVTVGNIGTERKMDYTVIGDMVNVASRLEGLTKPYKQPVIISELVQQRLDGALPTRLLDSVAVKGRQAGLRIYTTARNLPEQTLRGWEVHNQAMERYYAREFDQATAGFEDARSILGDDYLCQVMIERCRRFAADPPPPEWNGVETMTSK